MEKILTALAPYLGGALIVGVAIYGLSRISGIGRMIGTVLLVAGGVILGGAILLNPGAIGQIAGGIKGAADPYGGVREAAKVAQDVKLLQSNADAVGSTDFDCELAIAAGETVNPAWCAQLAIARADWNQQDLRATLIGLQRLQVKIGLVPQGTMLDTGWFDAAGMPILVTASVTTTRDLRAQIEDLKKVLEKSPIIAKTVAPSSTVTTTARVAVPTTQELGELDAWFGTPLGTAPADSPEWIGSLYQLPKLFWAAGILLSVLILLLLFRRR